MGAERLVGGAFSLRLLGLHDQLHAAHLVVTEAVQSSRHAAESSTQDLNRVGLM